MSDPGVVAATVLLVGLLVIGNELVGPDKVGLPPMAGRDPHARSLAR